MWILSLAMGTPEWSTLLAPERCQFGEEFALFLAQVTRQAHLEASIEIAVLGRVAQGRHAAPLPPDGLPRLAAGRHLKDDRAFEGLHRDLTPPHGHVQVNRDLGVEIVALAGEALVGRAPGTAS